MGKASLHPIMFLLNHHKSGRKGEAAYFFTSHYVPIKSRIALRIDLQLLPLHPIMFLLNHIEKYKCHTLCNFTSHYVPIKS